MTDTRNVTAVVGGRPVPAGAADWSRYSSTNPARLTDLVATVDLAPAEAFTQACRAAHDAQPAWADVPAPVRGRVIASIGRLVEANAEALAALITREIGKPLTEARGEVREIIDTCDFFLGEGRRLYGQTVPSEMSDKQLFTFREPIGTVAVITAGNFPVAVPAWYIIPALLCGNTIVWKPAEYAAASAHALFEIITAAGLPAGALNIVHANGAETFAGLEAALASGLVDKVGFTGSSEVGSRIGELCGRYLQSPCLELGGKNPMVVTADADLDLAVEGALFSGYGTAGQRCTSLGLLLVEQPVQEEFLTRLTRALDSAAIGDPTQDVLYGPLLDARFAHRFEEYLGWIGDGHRLLGSRAVGRVTAGNPRPGFVGDPQEGLYYHPVLVAGVLPEDRFAREETFGPIVPVLGYQSLDEAIEVASLSGYGLSASIYTRDPQSAFRFRRRMRVGMLSVNNSTSGAEAHLPFGGVGRSGNGSRQSGVWVLDQFTRWQSMNWDYSGRLQKAQIDVDEPQPDLRFRLAPAGTETGIG